MPGEKIGEKQSAKSKQKLRKRGEKIVYQIELSQEAARQRPRTTSIIVNS